MRFAIAIAAGTLLACSKPEAPLDWSHIEELAQPRVEPGPTEDLAKAVELARLHADAWMKVEVNKPPGLSGYPGAEAAVALLESWAHARGALPPHPATGEQTLRLYALARVAIDGAGDTEEVASVAYLGYRLVMEGNDGLDGLSGSGLLRDMFERANQLGISTEGWPVPDRSALVRLAAAHALMFRAGLGPDAPVRRTERGKAELRTIARAWIDHLKSARRDETSGATLDRLVGLDNGAGFKAVNTFKRIADDLAQTHSLAKR
jgi:hypothetical protein